MRGDIHWSQLPRSGSADTFKVRIEDLLEARPQQQRDAVEEGVQHWDAPALHY